VEHEGERHLRPSPRDRIDRGDQHSAAEHGIHVATLLGIVPAGRWLTVVGLGRGAIPLIG
jgi:hypothetical protein